MRKHSHHTIAAGSEDRIDNTTTSHASRLTRASDQPTFAPPTCLMDELAGEVIRLARLATAVHMAESVRRGRPTRRQEERA